MALKKNVQRFNADVAQNEGYLYTKTDRLSSRLANARMSDCVAELFDFRGKRVLDMGCGDGAYTAEFLGLGVKEIVGMDAAATAIGAARHLHRKNKRIRFEVLDVHRSKAPKKRFDVMVVRGLLHHLQDVEGAIRAMSGLAKTIIVVEPNGYNPVLKLIERTSRYHIEHEEKSYPPHKLDQWFEAQGGCLVASRYIGLVPFFFPTGPTRFLKLIEPLIEAIPGLKQISCAQYVQKIEMP